MPVRGGAPSSGGAWEDGGSAGFAYGRPALRPFRWPPRAHVGRLGDSPSFAPGLLLPSPTGEADGPLLGPLLAARSVLVLGLGAVGGPVLQALAKLGVGRVIGVDPDGYGERSHESQASSAEEAGGLKAYVQGRRAHETALPHVEVITFHGFAQDLPLSVLRGVDQLVLAGDNQELRVWAGHVSASFGKDLLEGAVHGPSWAAFVRGFRLSDPAAACPGCSISRAEWLRLRSVAGCDPDPESSRLGRPGRSGRPLGTAPTRTLSPFCVTTAQILAAECVKLLAGREGQALRSEELSYSLLTHRVLRSSLPRSPRCRLPHTAWRIEEVPGDPRAVSIAELAALRGWARTGLQVRGEGPWIPRAACASCGAVAPVRRFAPRHGAVVGACGCGAELRAAPGGGDSVVPQEDLEAVWDAPLAALGVALPGAAVGLSSGDAGWTYYFVPGEAPLAGWAGEEAESAPGVNAASRENQ
jgi:hypothetical protein